MVSTHDENQEQQPTDEVWGAQGEGQSNSDSNNASDTRQSGRSDENEQERSGRTLSPDNGNIARKRRRADIGGILGQLRRLQQAHLAYVDAHAERLKARLDENQEHRQQVTEDMQRLEGIILELLQDGEQQ